MAIPVPIHERRKATLWEQLGAQVSPGFGPGLMLQIQFWLGELTQRSPDPLGGFKGPTSKGKETEGKG